MAIDNGKIVAVGTADSLKTQYPMPPYAILTHADAGLINAHAHLDSLFSGRRHQFYSMARLNAQISAHRPDSTLIPAIQRGMKQVIGRAPHASVILPARGDVQLAKRWVCER